MPQPIERAAHLVEKFTAMQRAHRGGSSAAEAATNDLKSCALRINAIGREFSAFDILDQVRFTQTVTNPDTYVESTHRGSLALLELAALALVAPPSVDHLGHEPSRVSSASEAVQRVIDLGGELTDLTMIRKLMIASEQGDARDSLAFVANSRELFVRSPTYEHIAERTLQLLFGDSRLAQVCEARLGFTVQQACDLFKAIDDRVVGSMREYANRRRRFAELAESHLGLSMDAPGEIPDPESIPQAASALMRDAFEKLWFPIPAGATFAPSDLVSATGLPTETVESFLSTFTYVPPAADAGELILEAVSGPSLLRTSPILRDDQGRGFLVHSGIDMYAIREAVEERLKNTPDWNVYDRCRANYLEDDSVHLLTRMLPTAQVHTQVDYLGPTPNTSEATDGPSSYSRRFESDGLLVIDDIALIVEAKAGAVRPHARGGDGQALEQDLRKLVTNASSQAKRLHDLIAKDSGIRRTDGSWLDLSDVRRVHSIVVTLEDLSGLATTASELVARNLLSLDHVPWLVSLYDLHIVSDIVQRAAEFVLFLQRRTDPQVARRFRAFDEMDYFMAFLEGGLRTDHDAPQRPISVPSTQTRHSSTRGNSDPEPTAMLGSHTDPLDAWYMHKHGGRTAPAPRPELQSEQRIRAIVDALAAAQQPGWLSVGAALLDHDPASQKGILDSFDEALERTREDDGYHTTCAIGNGLLAETSTLILATVVDANDAEADMDQLAGYVTAKKHQTQSVIGAGMMFDLAHPDAPRSCFYDNRIPGPDTELDQLVERLNLHAADAAER